MKELKATQEYRRVVAKDLLCAMVIARGGKVLESDFTRAIQGANDFVELLTAEEDTKK